MHVDPRSDCAPSSGLRAAPLAAVLLTAACSADLLRPQPPPTPPEVRTPMTVAAGLPLVEGRLPDDRRAWFLVDTGAGDFTLLDERLSQSLGLKHDLVRDPLMPSIHFSAALPFLEVDGMGRRDLTVYVTDALAERAEVAATGQQVEGVLGAGFFRGHCLWFDWKKGEFTATRPRVRLARHVPIPLRRGAGGELRATVRVNGVDAEMLLDTGSPRTLVTRELADRLHVPYVVEPEPAVVPTSIGPAAVHAGTLPRLSLGSEELLDVPVAVVERRLPHAELVLGTDVLSRYGVILDLAERAYLVLDPGSGGAAPAGPERGD